MTAAHPPAPSPAGRAALVTGASRGIGRAIALRLAEAGCDIALHHHRATGEAEDVAARVEALGRTARVLRGDLSDPKVPRRLADEAREAFGRIDVLVNNAGTSRDGLLLSADPSDIEAVLATNLVGPMLLTRAVALTMVRQRYGRIVNVSSAAAARPGKGQAAYVAAKGGLESFTRAMAVELGSRGILVNAVAPGIVKTDMTRALRDAAEEELLSRQIVRSFVEPEAVAEAVAHLASSRNTHTTGTVLHIDGGMKMV